jgi:hypothetical protein
LGPGPEPDSHGTSQKPGPAASLGLKVFLIVPSKLQCSIPSAFNVAYSQGRSLFHFSSCHENFHKEKINVFRLEGHLPSTGFGGALPMLRFSKDVHGQAKLSLKT